MTNYYFATAALPPLTIGEEPEMDYHAFLSLLEENLQESDMEGVRQMLQLIDVYNLRAYWLGEPLDRRGRLREKQFEELGHVDQGFPSFLSEFLQANPSQEDRLRYYPQLLAQFFQHFEDCNEGFLKEYFAFERAWRLVSLGFRAKKEGRDLAKELQFEDPNDPLVVQLMAQKDAQSYEPPEGFEGLKSVFEEKADDPLALHKALCDFQLQRLEEMGEPYLFSVEKIYVYQAQLMLVERWMELREQEEQGLAMVESIVKDGS